MTRAIISGHDADRRGDRQAEEGLARAVSQQFHVPRGKKRVISCGSRPRKALIHLCQLICLRQRADSFFEKKPEERRSPSHAE